MPSLITPTVVDPAAGDVLGATQLNGYVRYVEFLHGLLTGGYTPFNGVSGKNDSTSGEWARWYFTYGGIKKVYNDFTDPDNAHTVYVQNDTGEEAFSPSGGAFANPLVLTGDYTLGNRYYIRLSTVSTHTGRVNYIYVPQPQSYAWAAPTTFTDGVLSSPTDFSTLSTDLSYLNTLAQVSRAGIKGQTMVLPGGGTGVVVWNGSFVYYGLNSLNISAGIRTPSGTTTVTVHVVDIGGSNDRTIATVNNSGDFSTPISLSGLSPALAVGSRYRLYINATSDSTPTIHVSRLHITGSKNLSPMPPRWLPKQVPYGSTHDPRLQYTSDALTLLKTLAAYETISGTDYPIQYPGVDNSAPTLVAGVTLPTFQDFRITRRLRFLHYLPITTGQAGNLAYASDTGDSVSLEDNNADGSWNVKDLDEIGFLTQGLTYKVTGVKSCYESASSSY